MYIVYVTFYVRKGDIRGCFCLFMHREILERYKKEMKNNLFIGGEDLERDRWRLRMEWECEYIC